MNTGRDNPLWLQFWRDQRNDFHQQSVNPLLIRFWPDFNPATGSRVFVPLCGKSLDMLWLAEQGHQVIGVELSPVAVEAFFSENQLKPSRRRIGKFVHWQHRNISILCGDFFALKPSDLGDIDLVYDRAALTALPEDLRTAYAAKLRLITPTESHVLLLTTEDFVAEGCTGMIDSEIDNLFAANFDIELTHFESGFEINQDQPLLPPEATARKVYRLSGRTAH
jgi:thiopurine S-methyltransferase